MRESMGSILSEEQKRDLEQMGEAYFEHIDVDKYKPVRPEEYKDQQQQDEFRFANHERYEYARIVLSLRSGLEYDDLNEFEKELFIRWNKNV